MPDYAKCRITFSFFLSEDDDMGEIKEEIMASVLSHPKIGVATFHAQVGYEVVDHYDTDIYLDDDNGV